MRLLETYSRNCSVDIKHKPVLTEKFFPLGEITKYITLQSSSGMPAKNYSYFQEVVNLIQPILEKAGIKILHLGQDSPPLNKVINLNNQTTLAQAAFILKKSMLHLGSDSWMAHFCGAENIPLVALYGSTSIENHSPYHFNKEKTSFIESHRNGNKPTFAREENPKTIDLINPETIAAAVLKLLELEFNQQYKTLLIGPNYQNKMIESANDSLVDLSKLGINNIILRNDYNFNLDNLISQVKLGKTAIVTNKPIPIQILTQLRGNIVEILYEIDEAHSPEFVKQLFQSKIPFRLYTQLEDAKINQIKLEYIDYPQVIYKKDCSLPEKLKDKDLSKVFYKSSKYTLGRGKIYQSLFDYKHDRPSPSFELEPLPIIDVNLEKELLIDKENLYFLEKV